MKTLFGIIHGINKPNSQLSEVLFVLITKGEASLKDFKFGDFRKLICRLKKKGIELDKHNRYGISKYGNPYTYGLHKLQNKEFAISVYNNLINEK
jgi:hypothetical protein